MNIKLNEALIYILITLSLAGCGVKAKKQPATNCMSIDIDSNDIITTPISIGNINKFGVNLPEYSAVRVKSPIIIEEYRKNIDDSFFSYSDSRSSHDKLLNRLREQAIEMNMHISRNKNGNMLDIRNLPIGFSYKMELDKPKKKAKLSNGNL